PGQYDAFNSFMISMETNLTEMHNMINDLYAVQQQIKGISEKLQDGPLKKQGESLMARLKNWDELMVQRKSKAYDDVENFPNKFTAEYLFLINQTTSAIPRVNKSSRDRKMELDKQWTELKATATSIIDMEIPAFNKALWEAGIGAVKVPE
ncbi:MAG: glycosyl hydrolase, partial [Eudoraea sp.]|nr:glycosyl hydrolase [Eudoraea sp.]